MDPRQAYIGTGSGTNTNSSNGNYNNHQAFIQNNAEARNQMNFAPQPQPGQLMGWVPNRGPLPEGEPFGYNEAHHSGFPNQMRGQGGSVQPQQYLDGNNQPPNWSQYPNNQFYNAGFATPNQQPVMQAADRSQFQNIANSAQHAAVTSHQQSMPAAHIPPTHQQMVHTPVQHHSHVGPAQHSSQARTSPIQHLSQYSPQHQLSTQHSSSLQQHIAQIPPQHATQGSSHFAHQSSQFSQHPPPYPSTLQIQNHTGLQMPTTTFVPQYGVPGGSHMQSAQRDEHRIRSDVSESIRQHPDLVHVLSYDISAEARLFSEPIMNDCFQDWCQIRYYEYGQRVGHPFLGSSPKVVVDGFCVTEQKDRMSIGSIGNGGRSPGVINVRSQIGKGISLILNGLNCDCFCSGRAPVFIQSPIHASKVGDDPSTVYRLAGSENDEGNPVGVEIFNAHHFLKLLAEAKAIGYKAVYALQRMCTTRISFVKGFGENYQRRNIVDTPVWIEIYFTKFLQIIDLSLNQVMQPIDQVSSTS